MAKESSDLFLSREKTRHFVQQLIVPQLLLDSAWLRLMYCACAAMKVLKILSTTTWRISWRLCQWYRKRIKSRSGINWKTCSLAARGREKSVQPGARANVARGGRGAREPASSGARALLRWRAKRRWRRNRCVNSWSECTSQLHVYRVCSVFWLTETFFSKSVWVVWICHPLPVC